MAIAVTNTNRLSIADKIVKGQEIITKSTGNPNAPGNAAAVAAFLAAQEDLIAANDAHTAALGTLDTRMAGRITALNNWLVALSGLAGLTQSVTGGVEEKILSTGFEVRRPPAPTPPLGAPGPLSAKLNGSPGVTKLSWPPLAEAKSYLVEQSPEPVTETSWVQVDTPTKASCAVAGAEPGKVYWFRVAAVGSNGAGPWSGVASRPVM